MKILVPIKIVVDPALTTQLDHKDQTVQDMGLTKVIDPNSAVALEQAIRIKEQSSGSAEILVVTISHHQHDKLLHKCIACGADRVLLIETESEQRLCSLDKAKLLYEVCKSENPELILMGTQSVDYGNQQTGPMLAMLLGWPLSIAASKFSPMDDHFEIECELDDGIKTVLFRLPGLITVDLSLNQPRIPSLIDIMRAKSCPIQRLAISEIYHSDVRHFDVVEITEPQKNKTLDMLQHITDLVDVIKANAVRS